MKSETINFSELQDESFGLNKDSSKLILSDMFIERNGYLSEFTLFLAHYSVIPNFVIQNKIECRDANQWFFNTYKSRINDTHYSKNDFYGNSEIEYNDIAYFIYDDLLVHFDLQDYSVRFLFRKTEISKVEEIINGLRKFKEKKDRTTTVVGLLANTQYGLGIEVLEIPKLKINLDENYNDDLKEVHNNILKQLLKMNNKGFILLYGKT